MKRIETDQLFRKPFSEMANTLHWGETRYLDSPNGEFYLTFSHFQEPHMGLTICLFNLVNKKNEIVENFKPLVALGIWNDAHWSENSKFFSTPIYGNEGYFICDVQKKKYTIVPIENIFVLKSQLSNTFLELEYRDDQIPDRNENKNYPTKIFLKPENIRIELDKLTWHKLENMNDIELIYKSEQVITLNPIDKGFRVFRGEFPLSTDRTIWDIPKM